MNEQDEIASLRSEIERLQDAKRRALALADERAKEATRLRAILVQFVAACDTAPPTSLMIEIGMACEAARAALKDLP